MYFTNTIKITMENNEAANTALAIIKKVLCTGNYSSGNTTNTAEELANDLQVKGAQIVQEEYAGYFTVEDIDAVMEDVLKAVAEIDSIHEFECEVISDSTYSYGEIEASYKNGLLKIKNTYYPCGYCEYLRCPECSEEIVKIEDFDPNKEYVCPECGEVIDLMHEYKECAPIVEEIEFDII